MQENHIQEVKPTLNIISAVCALIVIKKIQPAIAKLNTIAPEYRDDEWYFVRAKCALAQKNKHEAITFLEKIHYIYRLKYLSFYLELLRETKNYSKEIELLEKHPERLSNNKILQRLAKCYVLSKKNDKAKERYEELITTFSYYPDLKNEFLKFLIQLKHPDLMNYLINFMEQHPYYFNFHIIFIRQSFERNEIKNAFQALMRAFKQFPYKHEFYLQLIEYYMLNSLVLEASLQMQYMLWTFQYTPKVIKMAYDIKERFKILENPIPLLVITQVYLPENILAGFSLLSDISSQVYLVGGSIHHLLNGLRQDPNHDIDFVANHMPFNHPQFIVSPYNPRLYSMFIFDADGVPSKIDCFISPVPDEFFISRDIFGRDFTINSFYCDRFGYIYDPTGLAHYDFNFKILRTIKPAEVSFSEDPVRLIRAIKYIIMGYKPCPELLNALLNWQMNERFDAQHILAVTRKILRSLLKMAFVQALINYGLFSKLFGLECDKTLEESMNDLESLAYSSISTRVMP